MDSCKVYFCPHCERHIGKTAFFRHKRLYYDRSNKRWSKELNVKSNSSMKRIHLDNAVEDSPQVSPTADLTSMFK